MKCDSDWSFIHNLEYDRQNLFHTSSLHPLPGLIYTLLLCPLFLYISNSSVFTDIILITIPISAQPSKKLYCWLFFPLTLLPSVVFSCLQVRRGQQGIFCCGADAWRPGEGLGHVGRLPWKYLCQGPAVAPGRLGHYVLPPRLPPPEREQVAEISCKSECSSCLWIDSLLCGTI